MDKSPQAVFDKIVAHLRQQWAQSTTGPGGEICLYRGAGGLMCAVGCLIPDDVYTPDMEGSLDDIEFFRSWPAETLSLMASMQITHDQYLPRYWEGRFQFVSNRLGLVYTAPAP